jgi:regulator of sigma E protease
MMHFLLAFWDYVIVFLAILTVVVFVHEMGHFLVARWNGVKVEVFSIGFGPELFGRTARSGTRWRVSLLPFGGYVKMFGDADAASTPDTNSRYTADERKLALQFKPVQQRAAIVAAGPLANFLFGIVALAVLLVVYGEPRTAPVIGQVQPDSAAAEAGLLVGDRVTGANGETVNSFQDLQRIVRMTAEEPVSLTLLRDGQQLTMIVHPQVTAIKDLFGNVVKTPVLGVVADPTATELVRFNAATALVEATRQTAGMVSNTMTGLGQMIAGRRDSSQISGPLRIAKFAGQSAQLGIGGLANFVIVLSINLGLINLFPVPLLDGGHLLFYAIEAVRGRPLGARAQEYGFRIGLFLVFALMLFATRNDLVDLRVWEFIKGIIS